MDADSFGLLHRVVEGQLQDLRKVLSGFPTDQRGSAYVAFVEAHLDALSQLTSSSAESYTSANDDERAVYGRKLLRIRYLATWIHRELFEYRTDIGRRDLSPGLLYLVDYLIDDLLKASADPVIHLDGNYMYSTQRLIDLWSQLSNELGVDEWSAPIEPIIFNLPGLDPENALLAPILAHEVGHSVIQRNDLVAEVGRKLDQAEFDRLKESVAAQDAEVDIDVALQQFGSWVEELLCDALATELTGPSLLFSSAVFLPAPAAGRSGSSHPDPAQRISLTLMQLDELGWTPALERVCPNLLRYLRGLGAATPEFDPRENFLRELVVLAMKPITSVAQEYVTSAMSWAGYEPVEARLNELLNAGIPPAELDAKPTSPWHVIASIWLSGVERQGDTPEGLALVAQDKLLSRFALKTVEMSRVLELWQVRSASTA